MKAFEARAKNGRLMRVSECGNCKSRKQQFIKETSSQQGEGGVEDLIEVATAGNPVSAGITFVSKAAPAGWKMIKNNFDQKKKTGKAPRSKMGRYGSLFGFRFGKGVEEEF